MRVFSFVCFCSLALVVPSCSDESTSSPCARCPSGTHCESGRCVTDDAELTEIEDEADDADVEADELEHEVDVELVDEETAPDSVDGEESELIEELDEADEQELPDPTGRRCNTQVPCPDGFVCEEGVCAIDCHGNARCTSVCCAEGELCYLGQCTTPGEACGAVAPTTCGALGSCPPEQQCDPSLERCMPIPQSTTCEYRPSADFAPQELWHWEGFSENPAFGHAIATPAVADLNGDGVSDIVVPVTAHVPGTPTVGGILCALSGPGDCDGGPAELWCTPPTGPLVNWVASPAIADLDGDGALTIIAGAARGNPMVYGIVGYTAEGELIPDFGTHEGNPVDVMVFVGAPAVADLDGDGSAEVFVGFTVFDSEGHLLWSKAGATGNGSYGPLTVAVDLDGVPGLELVGGNMAYHASGSEAWGPTADARGFADGWPAIADFDLDGHAEVAVISQGILRIFDRHGMLFSSNHGQVEGHGGPPTIADFDGDGRPDIAIASRNALTVFRVGDDLEHTISPLWSTSSRDFSSNFTGVSVFDFDGNGLSEVIYGDECYVRVYEGPGDGLGGTRTLFEVPNTSCTGTEYPVVADVTGDGRAEFIVVANNAENMATACSPYVTQCRTAYPGYTPRHGVTVYRDAKDNWVSTRPIWNQHSYHVTNVCDGADASCEAAQNLHAGIPASPHSNWAFPASNPLNSFRANAQLEGRFSAPDLQVLDFRADLFGCPERLKLSVLLVNAGAISAPAGIPVQLFAELEAQSLELATLYSQYVLLPGASEWLHFQLDPLPETLRSKTVRYRVSVDASDAAGIHVNECDEENNQAEHTWLCDVIN